MPLATRKFEDLLNLTRASSKWVFNDAGILVEQGTDVPAFSRDPLTGASEGILVERSATNNVSNSSTLDVFTTTAPAAQMDDEAFIISSNSQDSPFGPNTGHRVQLDKSGYLNIKTASNSFAYFAEGDHASVYIRSNLRYCRVIASSITSNSVVYDLESLSVVSIGSATAEDPYLPKIEEAGNGWRRISMISRAIPGGGGGYFNIIEMSSNLSFRDSGNPQSPSDYMDLVGVQREKGVTFSSYIETGASSATRAVDNLDLVLGDWFDPTKGTLYLDFDILEPSSSDAIVLGPILGNDGSSNTDRTHFYWSGGAIGWRQQYYDPIADATRIMAIPSPGFDDFSGKYVFSYSPGGCVMAINGVSDFNSIGGTCPVSSALLVGRSNRSVFSGRPNMKVKALRYYPKPLSQAEAEALTA